ncbi:hypothetical protein X12_001125 [Xanthomonas arboricola]|uniref:hypothetical protein n=1 Tax=Xanthomonas arboricola TaxID=56448 RepID=UPI0012692922|nr:hypothetical protein [Xanthomonas arboricola]CAD7378182.1 hypothetical protein X12_001125 [Xanthomonas arboricola]
MPPFSIGIMTLIFGLGLPALWFISHKVREINAYSMRREPPTHRLGFYLPFWLLLGLVLGSFAQPLWEDILVCKQQGQKIGACLLIPKNNP